jgi:methyl-accepting chemotaxis protein
MFKNMKIGMRLGLGFGLVLLLLSTIAFIGITRLANLNESMELIVEDRYPKTVVANEILKQINRIARSMRNVLLMEKQADIKQELERIDEARAEIKKGLDSLDKTISSEKGKEVLKGVTEARGKYVGGQEKFLQLISAGKKDWAPVLPTGLPAPSPSRSMRQST